MGSQDKDLWGSGAQGYLTILLFLGQSVLCFAGISHNWKVEPHSMVPSNSVVFPINILETGEQGFFLCILRVAKLALQVALCKDIWHLKKSQVRIGWHQSLPTGRFLAPTMVLV
jgi:hypothetical protein